jgi:alkylation response protein AidB-like acyl-CoA dehydrogenase
MPPAVDSTDELVEQVERFLRERLPADWVAAIDRGDAEALSAAREQLDLTTWWVDLADAGYVTPTWPVEYGGLGVIPRLGAATARTLARYKVPRFSNPIGVDLAGPAIIRWGTEEQKQRFLRPIARHQEIWCQLFSEPGAGSDLAGLATRAVPDGDAWIVNGQKVWTSLGDIAAFGLLLARTNVDVPKHSGITVFLMPMQQTGVTVRPLRQMTGDAEFCEVFFDDARVDDSLRLGEVDAGWRVTQSVLMNERQAVGGSGANLPGTTTGRSVDALIRRYAPIADPALRQRVVQAYIEDKLVSLTNQRAAARRRAGQAQGPEGSITKLFYSEHTQRLQNLAIDLEGTAAQAWPEGDRWLQNTAWAFFRIRSKTIAGGTSEVQRNILGERVLGLPKEPAVDRSVPWSQVPRS